MKTQNKHHVILLAMVLLLSVSVILFASCGGNKGQDGEQTTVGETIVDETTGNTNPTEPPVSGEETTEGETPGGNENDVTEETTVKDTNDLPIIWN